MKIDYNILWVEDEESWYKTTSELFQDALEEEGFELKSVRLENIDQVSALIAKDGLRSYDILLVDFNLKGSSSGEEIIQLIRRNEIYTDILFYSSHVQSVTDSMHKYGLEGVYTADRKDIEDKFNAIFTTTIKKIQEINSMRGLIMGETSEMDVLIESLSLHVTNNILKLSEDAKNAIIEKYITDFLEKSPSSFRKQYKQNGFDSWFHRIECSRKWSIFRDLLKNCPYKENLLIKEFLNINAKYQDEVIHIRNKFAHAKTEEREGKQVLKGQLGKDDFEYDDNKFREIRNNLKKHRKNFNSIFEILSYKP